MIMVEVGNPPDGIDPPFVLTEYEVTGIPATLLPENKLLRF